jgi:hypothetical protein
MFPKSLFVRPSVRQRRISGLFAGALFTANVCPQRAEECRRTEASAERRVIPRTVGLFGDSVGYRTSLVTFFKI